MKKNEQYHVVCSGYTNEGMGVVKIDGFPLFVKGMLEGEEGDIVVTLTKKTYGFARLLKVTKASAERVNATCPVSKQCGGCQLTHMSYAEQLHFKKQKVQNVMDRIAKVDIQVTDVMANPSSEWYRNKCQIPVGVESEKVVTGFYRINSNTIIDTDCCRIQSKRINEVLAVMRSLLQEYHNAAVFRHILIKHAFHTGEVMVVWIVRKQNFTQRDAMVRDLIERLDYIKSVIVNINTREDNVILGDHDVVLYGEPSITDYIHDLSFHISSRSFYQVNPVQTALLYGKALEFCDLKGNETVLDMYCGVGTISMFLAQKAKRVIGIEIVPQAVADAKENAQRNHLANVSFVCSDAAQYAAQLKEDGLSPDIIVVDPPRKGCDEQTLSCMVEMAPEKIVYVSCDPATLARDLKYLNANGYDVKIVQPVDMFSGTYHVETVVLLVRIG